MRKLTTILAAAAAPAALAAVLLGTAGQASAATTLAAPAAVTVAAVTPAHARWLSRTPTAPAFRTQPASPGRAPSNRRTGRSGRPTTWGPRSPRPLSPGSRASGMSRSIRAVSTTPSPTRAPGRCGKPPARWAAGSTTRSPARRFRTRGTCPPRRPARSGTGSGPWRASAWATRPDLTRRADRLMQLAEADGNRTRQRRSAALTGFEDRGAHQVPRRLRVDSTADGRGYGVRRCRSRGNSVTSRMFSAWVSLPVQRSRPIANPPCGGMPCAKASR